MFDYFKNLFKKDPYPKLAKNEVRIRFRLPSGREFFVYAIDPNKTKKKP
jgi:hypothetical protein